MSCKQRDGDKFLGYYNNNMEENTNDTTFVIIYNSDSDA